MRFFDRVLQRMRIGQVRPLIGCDRRILDIGCADGMLFSHVPHLPGSVGVDTEPAPPTEIPGVIFIRGVFPRDLPLSEPFDVITMLAVLEHIPPAEQAALASACYERLAPGGALLLTVPSPAVDRILGLLKRLRLIDGMSLEQHHGFDVSDTARLFGEAGLTLIRRRRFQFGLNNLFHFRKPPCAGEAALRSDVAPPAVSPWPAGLKAAMAALVVLKLLLVSVLSFHAITAASYDDQLFVRLGASVLSGDWLGPYDILVLAKGPMYPIFIALSHLAGIPLILAQHLMYVLFCFVLSLALRPRVSRWFAFLVFAALLFNPMSFGDGDLARVTRDSLYAASTGLLFACAIGLVIRRQGPLGRLYLWSAGLGVCWSCLWLTREEGIWIVPSLALLVCFAAWTIWRIRDRRVFLRLAACGLPILIWVLALATICTVNRSYYGVFTTVELKARPFLDAYGALCRVKHAEFQPQVVVPTETRQQIYRVSPAFLELQPFLEGDSGRFWSEVATDAVPELQGEMGGWFIWALRHAVGGAGHAKTAPDAMEFYARLADEVNTACDRGDLPAGPRRSTLQPPWDRRYLSPVLHAFFKGARLLNSFNGISAEVEPSVGDETGMAFFREVTRSPLAPLDPPRTRISGWAFSPLTDIDLRVMLRDGQVLSSTLTWFDSPDIYAGYQSRGMQEPRAMHARFLLTFPAAPDAQLVVQTGGKTLAAVPIDGPSQQIAQPDLKADIGPAERDWMATDHVALKDLRLRMMNAMAQLYQMVMPILTALALASLLVEVIAWLLGRQDGWPIITLALLIAIVARLGLVSLIEAMSFPAVSPFYLAPAYPLLILFCLLAIRDGASILGQWRRSRPPATTS